MRAKSAVRDSFFRRSKTTWREEKGRRRFKEGEEE
jgi:hypothetical protein